MLQALMSLFVLASKDGWVNIMYNGLDAVAVDQQVRRLPCERTFFHFPQAEACFNVLLLTPPSKQESLLWPF